jgi:hypothetical protein
MLLDFDCTFLTFIEHFYNPVGHMLFDFDCTFLSFTDQLASFSFFYYWF